MHTRTTQGMVSASRRVTPDDADQSIEVSEEHFLTSTLDSPSGGGLTGTRNLGGTGVARVASGGGGGGGSDCESDGSIATVIEQGGAGGGVGNSGGGVSGSNETGAAILPVTLNAAALKALGKVCVRALYSITDT